MPSALTYRDRWKSSTAAEVEGSNRPLSGPAYAPIRLSSPWRRRARGCGGGGGEGARTETLEVARQDVRLSVPGVLEQGRFDGGRGSVAEGDHRSTVAHRDQRGVTRPARPRQLQLQHHRDVEQPQ